MSRKLLIATTLVLSTSLFPLISNAEDTANPNEMTKDAWLNSMTPLLPDLICKGFIQDPDLKNDLMKLK